MFFLRWIVIGLCLAVMPAQAAGLSTAEQAEVDRLQAYLDRLVTLETTFRQSDSAGNQASGRFWLHRPHRLRFEYDAPNPILIVARGSFLVHFDKELKEANDLDQEDTPAWFLLAENIRFGEQVRVRSVNREGNLIAVTAAERGKEEAGEVTLLFDHNPIKLRGWRLFDAGGNQVQVNLAAQRAGGTIDQELFDFRPTDYD